MVAGKGPSKARGGQLFLQQVRDGASGVSYPAKPPILASSGGIGHPGEEAQHLLVNGFSGRQRVLPFHIFDLPEFDLVFEVGEVAPNHGDVLLGAEGDGDVCGIDHGVRELVGVLVRIGGGNPKSVHGLQGVHRNVAWVVTPPMIGHDASGSGLGGKAPLSGIMVEDFLSQAAAVVIGRAEEEDRGHRGSEVGGHWTEVGNRRPRVGSRSTEDGSR